MQITKGVCKHTFSIASIHNKALKPDCKRVAVLVLIGLCDYSGYFEFSGGLQPLSLALYAGVFI